MARPEWMVPGQPVAVLRSTNATQSVKYSTIDRVLQRDVVLADGQRFNADNPVRSNGGSWDGTTEILLRTDAQVVAAGRRIVFVRRLFKVRNVQAELAMSLRSARDDDDLDTAITNALDALAALAAR